VNLEGSLRQLTICMNCVSGIGPVYRACGSSEIRKVRFHSHPPLLSSGYYADYGLFLLQPERESATMQEL